MSAQAAFSFEAPKTLDSKRPFSACDSCLGSGRFISFRGRDCGVCFNCGGTGQKRAPAAAPVAIDVAAVDRLSAAFDRAGKLRKPVMRFAGFEASQAPLTGRNPGAIYCKDESGVYLGKIIGGAFSPSRECSPEATADVQAAMSDPIAAALAYAKRRGRCCVCNAPLTEGKSVSAGMGPICRKRFASWHGVEESDSRLAL